MTGFGHYGWVWFAALAAILGFALYRRGRRLVGHQRFHERRVAWRTGFLALITVVALLPLHREASPLTQYASAAGGFAVGVLVALLALRLTRMGRDEGGVWYVPNLYLGIGLIALLVARFAYEYVVVFPQVRSAAAAAAVQGTAPPAVAGGPTLHGVLFLVLGYYLVYYCGILLRGRRLAAEAPASEPNG